MLSICIVTYNNEDTIGKTLEALYTCMPDYAKCRVYIVDNGSTDRTLEKMAHYLDRVKLIQSPKGNIGFSAANNLILNELDSKYHVIMNPDIYLKDNISLTALINYLEDNPDAGMAVPKIVNEQGELQYLCRRHLTIIDLIFRFFPTAVGAKRRDYHEMKDKDYNISFEVEFASGCFMMIRTELFKKLGGFDERFFLYAEDADLTRRVNQISKTVYVPQAVVCHAWERASYRDPAMTRIHLKSLWLYFRKWGLAFK